MIIKYISIVLGAIFEIYCVNIFMISFAPIKQIKKSLLTVFLIIITVFHIAISCFTNGIILTVFAFITTLLISQLYDTKQYIKIILSIALSVISIAGELIFGGIFMLIGKGNHIDINTTPESYALGILFSKFLVFTIILVIKSSKRTLKIAGIKARYLVLLSVLPITTIIFGIFMNNIISAITDDTQKILYISLNILLILANIITFEVIRRQNQLEKSEYELKLLKNSINEQTKHYEELKSSQEEIRQLRHNMKSICIGAIAELKAGKTENALEQLQNNISIIEKSSKVIDTGHPSIDSIIENKLNCCSDFNISTNLTYQYKDPITINEIEIAVILGNILDNAIEACQKITDTNKEIWGSITVDKRNIMINIKNTAIDSNNLKTSKTNKKEHGYGLKSISHIANKYNGYATFSFSDSIFTSYVILEN